MVMQGEVVVRQHVGDEMVAKGMKMPGIELCMSLHIVTQHYMQSNLLHALHVLAKMLHAFT